MPTISSDPERRVETDVLIIGGGLAALRAAVEARRAGCRVAMLTKGISGRSGSSAITSAGFSAAIREADPDDSPDLHYQDTMRGGGDVNNTRLVRILCDEAPDRFRELVGWGVEFERDPQTGKYVQFLSGDHSKARVAVCASHQGTGMTLPLKDVAADVAYLDRSIALDLMLDAHGVSGAITLDTRDQTLGCVLARCTILATGGIGQLYPVTSNPNDVTGDGLAMAYRAGATLTDLEFVQFYPWRLISQVRSRMPVQPSSFASGAMLRNARGERFMLALDPERMEATTRDLAARGIYTEIVEGRGVDGGVVLDLSKISLEAFARLNPRLARYFEKQGLSLGQSRMLLAPEAHFHMGGVRIDEWGHASLPCLYAAGEVAGGIDGGNRLDSNAIPAGQVFGRRAGQAAGVEATDRPRPAVDAQSLDRWRRSLKRRTGDGPAPLDSRALRAEVQDIMWRHAGIIRSGGSLAEGVARAAELRSRLDAARAATPSGLFEIIEVENMALAAELILRAGLRRTESRSAHYRIDYPARDDDAWRANIDLCRAQDGQPCFEVRPAE
jgi:fumarate reductase (CoM/CoB) subunit A